MSALRRTAPSITGFLLFIANQSASSPMSQDDGWYTHAVGLYMNSCGQPLYGGWLEMTNQTMWLRTNRMVNVQGMTLVKCLAQAGLPTTFGQLKALLVSEGFYALFGVDPAAQPAVVSRSRFSQMFHRLFN